jgi:hypothetical protein
MAIARDIENASIDDLLLDPKNPRFGRRNLDLGLSLGVVHEAKLHLPCISVDARVRRD